MSNLSTQDAVLLPYQQAWVADNSPVKVAEKSRRVGLSWAEAAKSVLEAAPGLGGQDTWYIGYNKDMAEEFILDCAFWAKHFNSAAEEMEQEVIADEKGDILTFKIRFASGNRVTALSSRPSNLRGKQGRVIIDEAAFHQDLKELLKAAFALLIWGGSISVISTHNGVDNPFNELIQDILSGKKDFSLHKITFEDAIAQGLCQRVFLATGKKWSAIAQAAWCEQIRATYRPNDAEELDCIPSQSGGSYLSRNLITSCMTKDFKVMPLSFKDEFELLHEEIRHAEMRDWCEQHLLPEIKKLDPKLRTYYGLDFARSGDLSVIPIGQETTGLLLRVPFIIELRNVPFKQQEQLLYYLADRLPRFAGGAHDARGNGQYLAEVAMQRYGETYIHQIMLTLEWYRLNMPPMKAAFEDRNILIPQDSNTLDDLRAIEVIKGIPKIPDTKNKGSDGEKRHGDTAIALCLLLYATRNAGAPIEFESVGDSLHLSNSYSEFMRAL